MTKKVEISKKYGWNKLIIPSRTTTFPYLMRVALFFHGYDNLVSERKTVVLQQVFELRVLDLLQDGFAPDGSLSRAMPFSLAIT